MTNASYFTRKLGFQLIIICHVTDKTTKIVTENVYNNTIINQKKICPSKSALIKSKK